MTRTKKWFVLKSNGKLRGYHVDPVSGDKKLQSIFTVTKSLMIGANTNGNKVSRRKEFSDELPGLTCPATKVVSMEVDDESKPLGQRGRELQVEAESLDEADKLAKALAFCLSAGEREKRPAEPAGGAVKPKPTSPAPPRAPLADQGAGEDEGSSSSSERGEDCDDDHDRGEVASPPKSNLKTLRQRNSLLGSSPLMADSLLGGDQVLPRSLALPRPEAAEAAAMVEAATPASSSEEEEEEDDSPIGKEIPDVRAPAARAAPSPSPSPSAQHLAEGLGQMQQLLIEQLAKRVDQLEGELRAQRGQIGAVEERQREQAMRPAPQPQRPAADPSAAMENFQQWGEIELLGTRMDRLEYQFEDLKVRWVERRTRKNRKRIAWADVFYSVPPPSLFLCPCGSLKFQRHRQRPDSKFDEHSGRFDRVLAKEGRGVTSEVRWPLRLVAEITKSNMIIRSYQCRAMKGAIARS